MSQCSRVTGSSPFRRGAVWLAGDKATCHEIACILRAQCDMEVFGEVMSDSLPDGPVAAAVGVLTTTTWSRLRHASPQGPQPVRNANWPWGLPWLTPGDRREVEAANDQLRNVLSVLQGARERSPSACLAFWHPEDLGGARLGRPASPWQLREVRRWANQEGLHRAAVFQCAFERSIHRLPIAVLFSHPFGHPQLHPGWPTFRGLGNDQYLGPLPNKCSCQDQAHSSQRQETRSQLRKTDGSVLLKGTVMQILIPMIGLKARFGKSALRRKGRYTSDQLTKLLTASCSGSSDSEDTLVQEVSDFDDCTGGVPNTEGHGHIGWDIDTMNRINIGIDHHIINREGAAQDVSYGELVDDASSGRNRPPKAQLQSEAVLTLALVIIIFFVMLVSECANQNGANEFSFKTERRKRLITGTFNHVMFGICHSERRKRRLLQTKWGGGDESPKG